MAVLSFLKFNAKKVLQNIDRNQEFHKKIKYCTTIDIEGVDKLMYFLNV